MFCVLHQFCDKSVDNGHCSVYGDTSWKNSRVGVYPCSFASLPEVAIDFKKKQKVLNALKASKRAAKGK